MASNRTALPSWLISMFLHVVLVLLLGWGLTLTPPEGADADDRTAEVGIVLKRQQGDTEFYQSEEDAGQADSSAAVAMASSNLDQVLSDPLPTDPSKALPSSLSVIGPGALEPGGVGTAQGTQSGPHGDRHTFGGKARTSVFGVEGEGYKFIYVFDRSASMGGSGRNALGAAKAQLIASLDSLKDTHQFQIIFYNEQPRIFSLAGQPNRLCFATEQNKRLAVKFVRGIVAAGGTQHEKALLAAIRMQPDVIFFLTDAGTPLYPRELDKIKRMATGRTTIHAIEFGFGPQADPNNFLVRLARDNGGQHGYVDITKRSAGQRQ